MYVRQLEYILGDSPPPT